MGWGGSNTCTDRELPPLGEPAGYEQSNNIAAGYEKDEHGSGPHGHQRCPGGTYELLVKGPDTGSEPLVRGLCGLSNAGGDEVHLGLGSGKRGGGPKPADNPQIALVQKRFLVRIDRQGCPDIHVRPRKKEKGLAEDPDNGERPVVQNDRGYDGGTVAPESRQPQPVTQNDGIWNIPGKILRREMAANSDRRPKHRQELVAHEGTQALLRPQGTMSDE